jgi:hypothetical protein
MNIPAMPNRNSGLADRNIIGAPHGLESCTKTDERPGFEAPTETPYPRRSSEIGGPIIGLWSNRRPKLLTQPGKSQKIAEVQCAFR